MASFLLTSCVSPCGYNDEPADEPFVDDTKFKGTVVATAAAAAAARETAATTFPKDAVVVDSSSSGSFQKEAYNHPPPETTRTGSTKSSHSSLSSSNNNNNNNDESRTMRRASASRRQQGYDGGASPAVRSRSQERSSNHDHGDDALDAFVDAVQQHNNDNDDSYPNDASTDNDSGDGGGNLAEFDDCEGGDFTSLAAAPPKRTGTISTTTNNNNKSAAVVGNNNYSQRGIHHRAMSDPFDTQEMKSSMSDIVMPEEEDADFAEAVMGPPPPVAVSKHAYPTLLRFPVAETRNKNCWSEPPVSTFSVRGARYFEDKKKQTSAPYLLTARGSDIFLFGDKAVNLQERSHLILGGHLRSVPTLMINFQFPWGVMVLYFEVPKKLAPYLVNDAASAPPLAPDLNHAERTMAKWFLGDEDYKNDRLKLIPYVVEGPWVVRNMVTGRPAIIGRKLPVSYRILPESTTRIGTSGHVHTAAPLCECTLDIGSSSATAKRIVSVCRRYMSGLTSDIGFVIQAESPDELPEQMLGSIRVHGPDPLKAPKI